MKRLPHRVELPGGYSVTVEQVDTMQDAHAEWDDESRTIRINRELSLPEKRWCLLHELEHAWADWKNWVGQEVAIQQPDGMKPDPNEQEDTE